MGCAATVAGGAGGGGGACTVNDASTRMNAHRKARVNEDTSSAV